MMTDMGTQIKLGLGTLWTNTLLFVPKLLLFIAILLVGFWAAKFLCRIVNGVLERVGFDRLVERGGVRQMLQRAHWDASDILGTVVKYFVLLFTFQLAFGVFGPNSISALLTSIIAYLPHVFVAGLILVIAGAIAAGVKQLIQAAIGGWQYGRYIATGSAVAIWTIGIFAALNQLGIAPEIVNGLFYAMLAIVVGSAVVAIGGGGIVPMRAQWERALHRLHATAPELQAEAAGAGERMAGEAEEWNDQAQQAAGAQPGRHEHEPHVHEPTTPRFQRTYPTNP